MITKKSAKQLVGTQLIHHYVPQKKENNNHVRLFSDRASTHSTKNFKTVLELMKEQKQNITKKE